MSLKRGFSELSTATGAGLYQYETRKRGMAKTILKLKNFGTS